MNFLYDVWPIGHLLLFRAYLKRRYWQYRTVRKLRYVALFLLERGIAEDTATTILSFGMPGASSRTEYNVRSEIQLEVKAAMLWALKKLQERRSLQSALK